MAAESSIADLVVVNDLYLIALCNGRNESDAAGLLAIPDEEYATELQLQEVIMSSAMAAVARSSLPLLLDTSAPAANNDATEATSTLAVAECSSSTSLPPLPAPATDNDATVATSTLAEAECSSSTLLPPLAAPATDNDATAATSTLSVAECSSSTSLPPLAAPATDNDATAATTSTLAVAECSSSSPRPSIPATFFFCKICMDVVPPSDAHCASRGCGHAFCATCIAGYIGTKIQDRIADVKCPEEGCGSVLDPELCQGMLPREAFEEWCTAMCESMVLGAKKVYCPFKDCLAMMVDDGDGDVAESECPSCRKLFCALCGVPWHAGVGCAEYGQLAVGDRGKEDLVVMEMAKGQKWKRCPRCKFFVQKSDGCLHITCRCGFEFCYGCGKQWGASHSSCSAA